MYSGHASWIALVFLGVMFGMRMLSSQRRRGSRRGPPSRGSGSPYTGSSFTGSSPRPDEGGGIPGPAPVTAASGTPAGWFTDPFVRHEQRFWSGSAWTEHVSDYGVPGTDPPPDTSLSNTG